MVSMHKSVCLLLALLALCARPGLAETPRQAASCPCSAFAMSARVSGTP